MNKTMTSSLDLETRVLHWNETFGGILGEERREALTSVNHGIFG